jgi:hypothetical protein
MPFRKTLVLAALLFALAPLPAHAQYLVTPFAGANFGGDVIEPPKATFGGAVGFMGAGIIGLEADFAFSPDFFPDPHPSSRYHVVGDIATVMGNVLIGAPLEIDGIGIRPYGTAGLGVIAVRADEPDDKLDVRGADLGFNFGAGLFGFFHENFGVRGDIRYFKDTREEECAPDRFHGEVCFGEFAFWRGVVGVTFRF